MDVIDLTTFHGLDRSTFTFDYSPIYFGNYSFEIYLNDSYLSDPQLICNATFDYPDPDSNPNPDPDPDPDPENDPTDLYQADAVMTLPLAIGMIGAVSIFLSSTSKVVRTKIITKIFKNKRISK